jgi:hypothetical protein
MKNVLMLITLSLFAACGTPNGESTSTPQPSPQQSPQQTSTASSNITVSEGLQVGATVDTLSREQYVNAMACAAEKAAPGSKFRFKSQWTAYQSPLSEASFNNAMAMGGDGQFIIYTQAISLGCLG